MKNLITLLTITLASLSFGQNFHEGTYVYEGSSFRFVVPDDFQVMETSNPEFKAYVTDLDGVMEGNMSDMLMIGQTADVRDITNEDLISKYEEIELDLLQELEAAEIKVFTNRNGQDFLTAVGKVDDFEEDLTDVYLGMTVFREVLVIVAFIDLKDGNDFDKSLLEAVLQSYTEYGTDRDNAFFPFEEEEAIEEEPRFQNDKFYTELSYEFIDVFPEITPEDESAELYWEEDWRHDYSELLLAYFYTGTHGSNGYAGIKIFSGGRDNYSSGLKKLSAVQKIFPDHNINGLKNEEQTLKGDMFEFEKYSVQSSNEEFGTELLYVTKIKGETVFVLANYTNSPYEITEEEVEKVVLTLSYEDF